MNIRTKIDPAAATAIPSSRDTTLARGMVDINSALCDAMRMARIAAEIFSTSFSGADRIEDGIAHFAVSRVDWENVCFAVFHACELVEKLNEEYQGAFDKARGKEGAPQ